MKLGRCPVCKSHLDVQTMVEDEAGRELLAALAKLPAWAAGPLMSYLGLFRPAKQDLSNSRTLALLKETTALSSDMHLLAAAMRETANQIHSNRQHGGDSTPLKNHRYLTKVMGSLGQQQAHPAATEAAAQPAATQSEAEQKEANFLAYKRQMEALGMVVLADGKAVPRSEVKNDE